MLISTPSELFCTRICFTCLHNIEICSQPYRASYCYLVDFIAVFLHSYYNNLAPHISNTRPYHKELRYLKLLSSMPCPTERGSRQRPTKTYVYKITVDDGVAPCAPPAEGDLPALLTLAICKPVIRGNAKPGDRIVGITSIAIHKSHQYPLDSVIYLAVVD